MNYFLLSVFVTFASLIAFSSCFNLRQLDCPPNGIAQCMAIVQQSADEGTFCQDAQESLSCVSRTLKSCFTRNDPDLLEALATYDITGLYQRMITVC